MCNSKKENLLTLNFKNIALESIGLILIGFGAEKLYVASQSEKYLALFANDFDKFQTSTTESPGWFLTKSALWRFGAFGTVFLLIGLFKLWKKNKKGLLDSIVSFLFAFALIHLGFYDAKFSNSIINFLGRLISDKLNIICIINGLFWSTLGLLIIWITIKKLHTTKYIKNC
ncbi:hypothetical protein Q4Q34_04885 [Flavivirga abyssicola]|uniref:hypothetical protein n=1 Tax=Flavivirga abyssicola TaxID=3063533 RepID=UPI0026E07212|nr:hypothetical protein [Flavivirga sp. MEBiC07777]WVK14362.1 hypothetical protein Q4Q34_04885 [Flavivirga sp. MEBiC07777]